LQSTTPRTNVGLVFPKRPVTKTQWSLRVPNQALSARESLFDVRRTLKVDDGPLSFGAVHQREATVDVIQGDPVGDEVVLRHPTPRSLDRGLCSWSMRGRLRAGHKVPVRRQLGHSLARGPRSTLRRNPSDSRADSHKGRSAPTSGSYATANATGGRRSAGP
jgi:hypothetical protein